MQKFFSGVDAAILVIPINTVNQILGILPIGKAIPEKICRPSGNPSASVGFSTQLVCISSKDMQTFPQSNWIFSARRSSCMIQMRLKYKLLSKSTNEVGHVCVKNSVPCELWQRHVQARP